MSGLERYQALLRVPHAKALVGWSLLGRVPLGMTPFALLLLVRGEGEGYGAAGVVVAVYSIALGLGAPIRGRRVDRRGPGSVLRYGAVGYAALLGLVVVLGRGRRRHRAHRGRRRARRLRPPAGLGDRAGRLAAARARRPPHDRVRVEASVQELFFVVGPLLAAALAALDPLVAVAGAALACLVGTLATARLAPVRDTPPSRASSAGVLGALASPGVRTIVLYAALVGLGFGACELAMPASRKSTARASRRDRTRVLRGRKPRRRLRRGLRPIGNDLRRFIVGAVGVAAGLLALRLAVSLPTLALLSFVAGLPIAPTVAALYTMIDRRRPGRHRGGGVRVVRDGDLRRLRARSGGRRGRRRGARRPLGVRRRCRDRAARGGRGLAPPGHAGGRPRSGGRSTLLASARSSGDRAADF